MPNFVPFVLLGAVMGMAASYLSIWAVLMITRRLIGSYEMKVSIAMSIIVGVILGGVIYELNGTLGSMCLIVFGLMFGPSLWLHLKHSRPDIP